MTTEHVKPNAKALLPIALFLVLYLGNGIFFEYIKPAEGQMGFYVVSVVLAFSIALIAAFAQNRKRTFQEKIRSCAAGIGDENITIMLFIFLAAGAFSGIAKEAGGALSTANNTVAIVIAAPIAKEISEQYHVTPKKTASLLDTCSCIMQGIIPYGAQLLVAAGIAGLTSVSLMPFLIYPYVLLVVVIADIVRGKG